MTVRCRTFRHVFTVQARSTNGFAGEPGDWATVTTFRGHIKPVRWQERVENMRDTGIVRHRVFCRWVSGINAGMRILHDGVPYDIIAVLNPDGQKRGMELEVEERA